MYEIKKSLSSFYFGVSALQRAFIVGNSFGAKKILRFIECPLYDCPLYTDYSIRV